MHISMLGVGQVKDRDLLKPVAKWIERTANGEIPTSRSNVVDIDERRAIYKAKQDN